MKSFKEHWEDYITSETVTDQTQYREFEFVDIITAGKIKSPKSNIPYEDFKLDEDTLPKQRGRIVDIRLTWRNKWFYIKMFFPQPTRPTRTQVNAQLQKVYPGAKLDYYELSNYETGQPMIRV